MLPRSSHSCWLGVSRLHAPQQCLLGAPCVGVCLYAPPKRATLLHSLVRAPRISCACVHVVYSAALVLNHMCYVCKYPPPPTFPHTYTHTHTPTAATVAAAMLSRHCTAHRTCMHMSRAVYLPLVLPSCACMYLYVRCSMMRSTIADLRRGPARPHNTHNCVGREGRKGCPAACMPRGQLTASLQQQHLPPCLALRLGACGASCPCPARCSP